MKYILAIILSSIVISSANANTSLPFAPAISNGHKGCISWAGYNYGTTTSSNFHLSALGGGNALVAAGDDAKIYITNLENATATFTIAIKDTSGVTLYTNGPFSLPANGTYIETFVNLFNIYAAQAAYILVSSNQLLNVQAHACFKTNAENIG